LFLPELCDGMLAIPTTGTAIDHGSLTCISQLRVAQAPAAGALH
jgi:hypothetical protein